MKANLPTLTARKLASEYFARRAQPTPEDQAVSFLHRIHVLRDGAWRSVDLVDTAVKILADATFDVDDLTEIHLHIRLTIESLSEYDRFAGSPVFGVAFPRQREIAICDRALQYLPLYRTCVAHELGHLMLHADQGRPRVLNYSPGSTRRPPEEREADEFMASLLAPPSVLKLATALAATQSGLHIGEVWNWADTSRGRFQWRHYIFPRLIDRLCLSRLLLSIQMSRLRVFSDATVEYHKTYALPNRWRSNTVAVPASEGWANTVRSVLPHQTEVGQNTNGRV